MIKDKDFWDNLLSRNPTLHKEIALIRQEFYRDIRVSFGKINIDPRDVSQLIQRRLAKKRRRKEQTRLRTGVYGKISNISKDKSHKKFSDKRKEEASKIKVDSGCLFCSEREPVCLDFHHLDPKEKEHSINAAPRDKMLNEIRKCVVLCANCHRKVHHGILELPFNYD